MTHRILVRSILIDVPSSDYDRTQAFWATALDARSRRGTEHPEYHVLDDAAARDRVLVQDVGTDSARFHIDIETDDVEAELTRLRACGAVEVERHEFRHPWPVGRRHAKKRTDYYVVLRDPAGLPFCVVPAESDDFPERSREVD
ncbi:MULTISPECIES: VOC family protein [Rhodococcus]|uniref:Glyoxalase-like domain-containing protein n=1 Tax=Rhodococcus wratislaviensis NBRC 100605 TaxID=1219028 RepID=X0PRL4_RHOWR|nr:VOC family protein [Rhodococcus wratislaviensis]GAF45518.1 hypothetical protein RW1_022_00980 [Rhodococcus wratislaviensis NBRC 100605]